VPVNGGRRKRRPYGELTAVDETTRRQITWVVILTLGLSLIIYAGQQRNLVPDALERLATGDLPQQVAAVQMLADRGMVAQALQDQPRWVQRAAVKALLTIGTPEAIQQLAETVPVLDEPVGKWATDALASFGRLAIGPLVECMQNKDGGVRAAAVGPLTKIGGTPEGGAAVIAAVSPFLGAYDDYVRAGVTAVLSALGTPAAPVAISALLQAQPAQDQSSAAFARAQDCAVEILVAMKQPALGPIITQLVPDAREKVRATAALMLGRMAGPLGKQAPEIVPPLLGLCADPAWAVRRRAVAALGELGKAGQSPPILAALTARLQDQPEVKAAAAQSLGLIAAPSTVPALVQTLIANREGAGQELVAALEAIGPAALPGMGPALNAAAAEVRDLATQAVAGMGAPAGAPLLAARLSDAAVEVRRVAATALETQATPATIDALSRGLGDSDPAVYSAVERAFIRLGTPAVAPLIARLGAGDPRVALVASQALTALGPPAVPALAAALQSGSAPTRQWAAVALGQLGRVALPRVAAVLAATTAPETARASAAEALGRSQLAEAVAPLAQALAGATPALRQATLRALAATRQPDATTPLVQGVSDSDPAVALTALRLLLDWQLGKTDEELAQVVGSGAPEARRRAAVALAYHEAPGATPLLGTLFGAAAAASTGQRTDLAPLLNETAQDPAESDAMRRLALVALAYRGDQSSVAVLSSFLTPGNPLAPTAARALGTLGGRLAVPGGAGARAATAAAQQLVTVLDQTPDDALRLQVATALSLMQAAPVADLLDALNQGSDALKPWTAAILGALGKPANDAALRERGLARASQPWAAVALQLIGDPEALKFLQRLPQAEQPEPEKLQAARVVYDRIMQVRAEPLA
jgi:HEAT repeat protein